MSTFSKAHFDESIVKEFDITDDIVTKKSNQDEDYLEKWFCLTDSSSDSGDETLKIISKIEESKKKKKNGKSSDENDVQEVENCDVEEGGGNLDNNEGKSNNIEETSNDNQENSNSDSDDIYNIKPKWKQNKLLVENICLDDSSDEETSHNKVRKSLKKKKSERRNVRRSRIGSDDSSEDGVKIVISDSSDSSIEGFKKRNKKRRKSSSSSALATSSDEDNKKKKRKRIKMPVNSSSDSASGSDKDDPNASQLSQGKGRKNIRKVMKKDELAEATREAAKEEEDRRKRIAERQAVYNKIYEIQANMEGKVDSLVLDFDTETKKELVAVDKDLVVKLKPHQADGVKFMWDSCFESVDRINKTSGSGCILAHCMGLGKTFQVVTLVHTLLTNKLTKIKTVLVVCPLSTVLNWNGEFVSWLKDVGSGNDIEVFNLMSDKANYARAYRLRDWSDSGGVMIMGYDLFRILTNENSKAIKKKDKETFKATLLDPGPDLVVCDEGHMLKNEATALSKSMNKMKTLRRIVLTGTPLQNNLSEYHCMVQFVKPNLLGSKKEFLNRFVNPITNGQFVDSTDRDVKVMKRRAHVLHKMLEGLLQRRDYSVLTPYLPQKHEYVLSIRMSEIQISLYQLYLKTQVNVGRMTLFPDWQALSRIWSHPLAMKYSHEKAVKTANNFVDDESEGSIKDFVVSSSEGNESSSDSSNSKSADSVASVVSVSTKKKTRSMAKSLGEEVEVEEPVELAWWNNVLKEEHFEDMRSSPKLMLLFSILTECELIGDKVLVFSQSLFSLNLIEHFLREIDNATQEGETKETLCNCTGKWVQGSDYFRLDGSTSGENRTHFIKSFNKESNLRARLFLISTKAGGLGINLTGANRVVIFDASWNPSHDVQSIFRVYRFGQKKPCYIYRFIAQGTMEEKVYERQVAKLSLSSRVVDEQQVHRHFSHSDLQELYTFTPAEKKNDAIPILPKDRLMADMLQKFSELIYKCHEHDSLLDHVEGEELNEEERKAAWEEFENEKKRGFALPAPNPDMANFKYFGQGLPPNVANSIRDAVAVQFPNMTPQDRMKMELHLFNKLLENQKAVLQVQPTYRAVPNNMWNRGHVAMPMPYTPRPLLPKPQLPPGPVAGTSSSNANGIPVVVSLDAEDDEDNGK